MDILPIRSDDDYRQALAKVNRLAGAVPGSADFDRLDIWITLVEAYEARICPIEAPDPIDAIMFAMERIGIPHSPPSPARHERYGEGGWGDR